MAGHQRCSHGQTCSAAPHRTLARWCAPPGPCGTAAPGPQHCGIVGCGAGTYRRPAPAGRSPTRLLTDGWVCLGSPPGLLLRPRALFAAGNYIACPRFGARVPRHVGPPQPAPPEPWPWPAPHVRRAPPGTAPGRSMVTVAQGILASTNGDRPYTRTGSRACPWSRIAPRQGSRPPSAPLAAALSHSWPRAHGSAPPSCA